MVYALCILNVCDIALIIILLEYEEVDAKEQEEESIIF